MKCWMCRGYGFVITRDDGKDFKIIKPCNCLYSRNKFGQLVRFGTQSTAL